MIHVGTSFADPKHGSKHDIGSSCNWAVDGTRLECIDISIVVSAYLRQKGNHGVAAKPPLLHLSASGAKGCESG